MRRVEVESLGHLRRDLDVLLIPLASGRAIDASPVVTVDASGIDLVLARIVLACSFGTIHGHDGWWIWRHRIKLHLASPYMAGDIYSKMAADHLALEVEMMAVEAGEENVEPEIESGAVLDADRPWRNASIVILRDDQGRSTA